MHYNAVVRHTVVRQVHTHTHTAHFAPHRFMICCDICEEWFHGDCVGISVNQGRRMERAGKEYICPVCTERTKLEKEIKSADRSAHRHQLIIMLPFSSDTILIHYYHLYVYLCLYNTLHVYSWEVCFCVTLFVQWRMYYVQCILCV